jgi:DMSO/TMAO reductase YedYZ molybdopterin-dependent catalytic subunit
MPTSSNQPTRRPGLGPLLGLLALFAGLGVAEAVAGFSPSLRSPIIGVGDRFIDLVPAWLKTWAIDTFGTNDKAVLLIGIVVVVGGLAMLGGHLALTRSLTWGDGLAAGLSVVAIFAILSGRNGSLTAIIPSVIAGLVAAATLRWLIGRCTPADRTSPITSSGVSPGARGPSALTASPSRRKLLKSGVVFGALAVVGVAISRRAQRSAATVKERLALVFPSAKNPLPNPPVDPALSTDGLSLFFTPNNEFYRIDTALTIPQLSTKTWKLRIDGYVDKPALYTYDDLLKMDLVEVDATIACVSNEVGGDLVGNARWLGVRLDTLLALSGIQSKADQIFSTSVDGFTCGFPVDVLDGRDAILAIGMNGEPLPPLHGYPARLIVPGIYGYVSATKWLESIELTRFDEKQGYWMPRGWSRLGPVKTHSRIDRPKGRIGVEPTVIAGVAWAPTIGIAKVEVQVDEGPWRSANLGPEVSKNCWRQWWVNWTPEVGQRVMRCRATDTSGYTQTSEIVPVAPDGATGWHERMVFVES